MTELLPSSRTRATAATTDSPGRRPLWLGAGAAGVVAAGSVLVACMALGLVGWFASDAGSHGDTRDAIRVGADAWLLAHGAPLELAGATVSVMPLGLTALCLYVAYRLGRWAVVTSALEDSAGVAMAAVVLAGLYGLVALLTALLASTEGAEPALGLAFVGGVAVGLLGGGVGLASASAAARSARQRLPVGVRAVATGSTAVVLLMVAAGSVLVVVALLLDLGEAANVLSRLHPDAAGAGLYTGIVAGAAPNASLLAAAYLLGPGFAVGTGTLVSPSLVVLGPVPAFPLLAALPASGPGPAWAAALVGVPVLVGVVAAALVVRRYPATAYEVGGLHGLSSGVVGGVALTGLVSLAGGSVGPGRMADVGAPALDTLTAAVVALGVGGLVGGLVTTWWVRRHRRAAGADEDRSTEDTVIL